MFIMNFKEIHSNTEFLSTYRRAMSCSCRNKIKNTFIEKCLERSVQGDFGTFRLLRVGSTNVQLHSQKTKFISLSRSLTACRNLLFNFFYTLNFLLIFNLGGN